MTVEQLWDKTWGHLQDLESAEVDFITAVNEATEQLFNYLFQRQSDLVKSSFCEPYQPWDAGGAMLLPDGFFGLAERPYMGEMTVPLEAITEADRQEADGMTGDPRFYELRGATMKITPAPEIGANVYGVWIVKPCDVTAYTENLPLSPMLTTAYKVMLIAMAKSGIAADFGAILDTHVGKLIQKRDCSSPRRTVIRDF